MSKMKKSSHFPAIDGLRGIFALAVLIAHVNLNWLPHVHIVMDIFFTISAFLITLALIKNINKNGKISLLIFTKRRLLRLYPALVFCVAPYTIAAYFLVETFNSLLMMHFSLLFMHQISASLAIIFTPTFLDIHGL